MSGPQPLSAAVRAEALTVCRTAFYHRDDLKSLMLGAGASAAVYDRYDQPEIAKVRIARSVLDELQELGAAGWAVQREIVVELCGMQRPAIGVEGIAAGRNALAPLRRVVSQRASSSTPSRPRCRMHEARRTRRVPRLLAVGRSWMRRRTY
jgi:hypothetical protein